MMLSSACLAGGGTEQTDDWFIVPEDNSDDNHTLVLAQTTILEIQFAIFSLHLHVSAAVMSASAERNTVLRL